MPEPHDCYTSPHASLADGLFHEIRDEDFVAGQATGVYRALCGAQVPVVDAFGPACQPCLRQLHHHRAMSAAHRTDNTTIPPQRRRSRLRILLGAAS